MIHCHCRLQNNRQRWSDNNHVFCGHSILPSPAWSRLLSCSADAPLQLIRRAQQLQLVFNVDSNKAILSYSGRHAAATRTTLALHHSPSCAWMRIVNQTNGAPNQPPVGCLSLGSPCAKGAHCTSPANVGQRLVVRRGTPVHARAHIARDHVSTVTYILLYNPVVVANWSPSTFF